MKFWTGMSRLGLTIPSITETTLFPNTQCHLLNGRLVADRIVELCRNRAQQLGIRPHLTVVLAGDDPASEVYVRNKMKTFAKAEFSSDTLRIPTAEATREHLLSLIDKLNANPQVNGILVQLPLPAGLEADEILTRINPTKDVDGFLAENIGRLALGDFSGALSCTPFGVMVLLSAYGVPQTGSRALVIGRSNIVGKPMSLLLLSADCTVTMAHSRSQNLPALCREADIIVAAAGRPKLIRPEWILPGATVIDVGMHRLDDGTLCGDVDPSATEVAGAMTPVPGGVGPLTIAMLMANTLAAATRQ